jgi:hypothetical protein
MSKIESLLGKLDSALGKKKATTGGRIDYKALAAEKAKRFLKLKEGKNNIVFVCPEGSEDPFQFWGYHNNLQEVSYYSVPCDLFNKNEECLICKVVEDLKKENYEGNKHIWFPIRQQIEYYAPVVNVESQATIDEGMKWLRVSKSVMTQMTEWLRNLEKDEKEFYSDDEPQKVIITYDKSVSPTEQYKLDKKNFKGFSEQQLADWRGNMKPVSDFILSKGQNEVKKIVDAYFEKIANEVSETLAKKDDSEAQEEVAAGKLSFLKKN